MIEKLALCYMGEEIHRFDKNEKISEIIDIVNEYYEGIDAANELSLKFVDGDEKVKNDNPPVDAPIDTPVVSEDVVEENSIEDSKSLPTVSDFSVMKNNAENKISESIAVDVPEKEWTIWSSSDFAEDDEQIPLVKIIMNDAGELEAVAVGDDNFDQESLKTAANSLKFSVGKPINDRILRVDKSLNHSDPFLSTEIQRNAIRANRGTQKKSIKDLIKQDPKTVSDEPRPEGEKAKVNPTLLGLTNVAAQVLLTNRDEMKAAANNKLANEDKLVDLFKDMTGVDYYTEKIVDEEQYNYILDLMGRSYDNFDKTYLSPDENPYIQGLKDLTEDLIEKVLLRTDPDFYK